MEKLYTEVPDFKLVPIKMNLFVTQYLTVLGKLVSFNLSDCSYGEYLINEGNKPKFYFNIFNSDGSFKKISQYTSIQKIDCEEFLIKLLKNKGYLNVNIPKDKFLTIRFDSKSYIENVDLLEIQDCNE